jgi:poly(A) polymerase
MAEAISRPSQRPLVWSDALLDLFDMLAEQPQAAYVVGGAVRDAFLRRAVKDLDLATPDSGMALAREIANRMGGAYYPLDAERDVGRAILDTAEGRLVVDVARFRGGDLASDLADRDFTINAIAVDVHGDPSWIIDPLGSEQDLLMKVVRRCNPQSIASDPIRALRAIRQSTQLGFRIEPQTLTDVRANVGRLNTISPERGRDEYFRLLALPRAAVALKVLDAVGGTAAVAPELAALRDSGVWARVITAVERLGEIMITISPYRTDETAARFSLGMLVMGLDRYRPQLQTQIATEWADERTHQALLTFALLMGKAADSATAERRAAALPLSNRERDRLTLIWRHPHAYLKLGEDRGPLALHRYWRMLGEAGVDICLLSLAEHLASVSTLIDQDDWIRRIEGARALLAAYYDQYDTIVQPPTLLDGNALMAALGLKPSALVGKLMDAIREAQVTGEVATVEDALALARRIIEI